MENNNDNVQKRRTILFSIINSAILTASIIFFIIGAVLFARAKNTQTVIYIDQPYDPKGEEAEENAKVDLVYAQKMFENKNQYIEHVNLTNGIEEDNYLAEGLYGYEYQYVNTFGRQTYRELIWADGEDYVKRFVNDSFVGYTFHGVAKARDYVESKQHWLELDAYELTFDSNSGASSYFTTVDPKINELYAHYTHQAYDPDNPQTLYIGLYPNLQEVMITPDKGNSDVSFLLISPREDDDQDGMPCSYAYNTYRYYTYPDASNYAYVDSYLLPTTSDYERYYVQPKGGSYGHDNNFSPDEDYKCEYILGFVDCGDTRESYGSFLSANFNYDSVNEEYYRTQPGYHGSTYGTFTYHVKVSYKTAAETNDAFEDGLLLVDCSRTFIAD